MLISIIIPMYNSARYLEKLFASLKVSNNDIEIVLIDDGSEDDTYEKCIVYQKNQRNVCLIHNSNHGVSYSRNCGIKCATGEYVMFVDADDILLEGWYDILIRAINVSEKAEIIAFSAETSISYPTKREIIHSIIGIEKKQCIGYLSSVWSKLYKRNFLLNQQIQFDVSIIHGEDALFNIEAFLKTEKYYFMEASIYSYYINYSSATHKYDENFLISNNTYIKRARELLMQSSLFQTNEVTMMMEYSFANSVYIYVGKTARLKSWNDKAKAVRLFYDNAFCSKQLRQIKTPRLLPMIRKLVYVVVRYRLFWLLEGLLSLSLRKQREDDGRWMII